MRDIIRERLEEGRVKLGGFGEPVWSQAMFELTRLRHIEEAARRAQTILAPIVTGSPVYERTTAHFDAESILRTALAGEKE